MDPTAGKPLGLKRQVRRIETGPSHVHANVVIGQAHWLDKPRSGLNPNARPLGEPPIKNESRKTPCTISALFNLVAIGIEDSIEKLGLVALCVYPVERPWLLDEQDLVGAHAQVPAGKVPNPIH